MVNWPAVIKYTGEDELLFIKSKSDWIADNGLNDYCYHSDDVLLDSSGSLFSINNNTLDCLQTVLPMKEFESWIKHHIVTLNQCCSSKLSFSQYSQGLLLVEQLCENNTQ